MARRVGQLAKEEGFFVILGAFLEVLFFWLSANLGATDAEKVMIALQIFLLVFIFRYIWVATKERAQAEYYYDVKHALERAHEMQDNAQHRVDAVWALVSYDDSLRDYFIKTLSRTVSTRRVIDVGSNSIDDICDHILKSWEYLGKSYFIYVGRNIKFEVMIIDNREAALFLFAGWGPGCLWERHTDSRHVIETQNLFENLVQKSLRFPYEEYDSGFDETRVKNWLSQR